MKCECIYVEGHDFPIAFCKLHKKLFSKEIDKIIKEREDK